MNVAPSLMVRTGGPTAISTGMRHTAFPRAEGADHASLSWAHAAPLNPGFCRRLAAETMGDALYLPRESGDLPAHARPPVPDGLEVVEDVHVVRPAVAEAAPREDG